eukprot:4913373-Pyramimonas_sp.AAC.1
MFGHASDSNWQGGLLNTRPRVEPACAVEPHCFHNYVDLYGSAQINAAQPLDYMCVGWLFVIITFRDNAKL